MNYDDFIAGKLAVHPSSGFTPDVIDRHAAILDALFPHQRDMTRWALMRGRGALFADTGLGKTRMQLLWAAVVHAVTGRDVLILAPLGVAKQTVAEGASIGVHVHRATHGGDVQPGINITNYDRLHLFAGGVERFVAVVLDESSCIKNEDSKTFQTLTELFRATPFKLCCSATPAPNDWTELGQHAEFLGVCTCQEMLAEFFKHDGGDTQKWELKKHARAAFWRWVASWALMVKRPSDLGYSDEGYVLPPISILDHVIKAAVDELKPTETRAQGLLFAEPERTLSAQRKVRKASLDKRVEAAVRLINASPHPWLVWCDLNDESKALAESIRGAVEVRGSMKSHEKEGAFDRFTAGDIRVLVTKPSIAGFGLNWQHVSRMCFVGVTHSWEAYYQAVRRAWRFGQRSPVEVHVIFHEMEGDVVRSLRRKDADAEKLAAALSAESRAAVREAVHGARRTVNAYAPTQPVVLPQWLRSA